MSEPGYSAEMVAALTRIADEIAGLRADLGRLGDKEEGGFSHGESREIWCNAKNPLLPPENRSWHRFSSDDQIEVMPSTFTGKLKGVELHLTESEKQFVRVKMSGGGKDYIFCCSASPVSMFTASMLAGLIACSPEEIEGMITLRARLAALTQSPHKEALVVQVSADSGANWKFNPMRRDDIDLGTMCKEINAKLGLGLDEPAGRTEKLDKAFAWLDRLADLLGADKYALRERAVEKIAEGRESGAKSEMSIVAAFGRAVLLGALCERFQNLDLEEIERTVNHFWGRGKSLEDSYAAIIRSLAAPESGAAIFDEGDPVDF